MGKNNYRYPFTAVVGQERLKKAIILNLINNKIGGVLIDGEKGVSKSTIVRGIGNITSKSVINLPLNVSEDMLLGGVDLEKTIASGKNQFEEGLLSKADGNVLYVDEVNLLGDNIVDLLLDVLESKKATIEREGISKSFETNFLMIGTMNKEMGELRSEFLDRFPLYVDVKGSRDEEERIKILKSILNFEKDPIRFIKNCENDEMKLRNTIENAKEFLKNVIVTEKNLELIVKICNDYGVIGHRADIILEQTAKTIAALELSKYINDEHILEAASLVIPHRLTRIPEDEEEDKKPDEEEKEEHENQEDDSKDESEEDDQEEPSNEDENSKEGLDKDSNEDDNSNSEDKPDTSNENNNQTQYAPGGDKEDEKDNQSEGSSNTEVFSIGTPFKLKEFLCNEDRVQRKGNGKRSNTKSKNKMGQYLYSTQRVVDNDIAFAETIRAAAPYQNNREKNGVAIALRESDLRGKVRKNKVSNLIVFVVDSSGSVGVNKRMIQVKAAILSMLKDSYVKRDKISLIIFRGNESEIILPPTSSVERGYKLLKDIKTGGKTPLNSGLVKGFEVIKKEMRQDDSVMPMLVVISDGRGNVTIDKNLGIKEELIKIANGISEVREIKSIVIDVEKKGMMSFDRAKLLADNLNAEYVDIENLKSEDIVRSIEKRRNINE